MQRIDVLGLRLPSRERIIRAGLCLGLVAFAVGCSSSPESDAGNNDTDAQQSSPGTVSQMTGTLNYDGLRSDNLCQGGGDRPCFAPIRREPRFARSGEDSTAGYLNDGTFDSAGRYLSVEWPYEASQDQPADELTIVCRVTGDEVYGYDTASRSSVWDVVEIPAEHSRTGRPEVGYTPERWMELAGGLVLDACSPAENPAGAPVVTTPTE